MTADDIAIVTGAEVRELPERHALVVAENGKPILAKLRRVIDGKRGRALMALQAGARTRVTASRTQRVDPAARATAAHEESQRRGLSGWGSG